MNKKIVIGLVVSLVALGLSGYNFVQPTTTEVIKEIKEVGAMPGSELSTTDFTRNGYTDYVLRNPLSRGADNVGTTTLCSFKNPVNATTTIDWLKFQITTGTGTAATIVVATSTRAYATTSANNLWGSFSVAADSQAYFIWDTNSFATSTKISGSYGENGMSILLKPSEYILFMAEGTANGSGYIFKGTCTAKLGRF